MTQKNMKVSSLIDKRIPVLYICFYKRLYETYSRLRLDLQDYEIISSFRQYLTKNVANARNYPIVQDLVYWGLLKKISKNKYELQTINYKTIVEPIEGYWAW